MPRILRFIDGKPVNAGIVTRAELLGQGLFETMRWQGGIPLLPWHLKRLRRGAADLGYNPDLVESLFLNELEVVTAVLMPGDQQVVRFQLSHTQDERGYATQMGELSSLWQVSSAPSAVFSVVQDAIFDTQSMPFNAGQPGKFSSRLDQVLAADRAQGQVLLRCDHNGFLREGLSSNLFFYRQGILYTPDLSQWGVEGTFRAWLIAHWRKLGRPVITGDFRPDSLQAADAVWLCNAVRGVQVVTAIGPTRYNIGLPIIKQLEQVVTDLFYENS
ncbi:aminotransferase class IV [Salinispirillum sp. LH 10-3-1]|uniref:Aminotransferase class IV n=1 Tax=Salinispirillum sp. LH 10-3-1 TaxID=2952525 RepID=A0AB38YCS2_9GAMM